MSYVPFTGAGQLDGGLSAVREATADALVVFPNVRLERVWGRGRADAPWGKPETYVRLATYADTLLHGARTAELPIEQPIQFKFVLNMRTAAALGVTTPQTTLLRANQE